jgi:hypothetical protein
MSKLYCNQRLINLGGSYYVASKPKIKNWANSLMMLGCMVTGVVGAIEDATVP